MVAAIRPMAEDVAGQIGKTALGERVLMAMAKVARHEFVPIEVQQYAHFSSLPKTWKARLVDRLHEDASSNDNRVAVKLICESIRT